jgi:predicted nucleotidyltransferase
VRRQRIALMAGLFYSEDVDFYKVLGFLITDFGKHDVLYALMGGFAMGAYGIVRATTDLDFLIATDDLDAVKKIMRDHGYRCIYESENVAQFASDLKPFGAVDFLLAFRPVSKKMLERKKDVPVFEGELMLSVLAPEDIIGLKIQSLVNNPERKERDEGDIKAIMAHFGVHLDWNLLREHFLLFDLEDEYVEYEKRFRKR